MHNVEGLDTYLDTVFQRHCPYLGSALEKGSIDVIDYSRAVDILPGDLPGLGCLNAERLRICRRSQIRSRHQVLACTILVFPNTGGVRKAISNTHFILKVLFTRQGMLFGKFWPGQGLVGDNEQAIPDPPMPILVLRSSLPSRDEHFFEKKSRPFHDEYLCAEDDGAIVEGPFLHQTADELRAALCPEHFTGSRASEDLRVSRTAYRSNELIKLLESDHGKYRTHHPVSC